MPRVRKGFVLYFTPRFEGPRNAGFRGSGRLKVVVGFGEVFTL